ncbi:putative sulfate exporter family transporter [Arcobacter cryaerophilus gv. pseudocryaerophilus]|uniref:Sulfate exporter family transporter n=3 Tax=unclassified Arcobacter TaxID=2593671 RepID=A0AA96DLL6_9BACT|nr:putative sulfate exporter family transporter [Arcobacter sp. AZ-2023]WPD05193.1 putative sulfate exporter family transporter [Arcobacter sp. DSM 115956]WPD07287.1 putative sulfate exporter family transporter [Arcobacter sp. DSM 115955]WNL31552.1 putative sulfate exporter family transporter [Arcobacter sp. AZ-2023]WNP37702.1 putative sulfate exporter family transporter [Arcobacter sp. AZ-2023]
MKNIFKTEDFWSIWLGFLIFLLSSFIPKVPKFNTWEYNIFSIFHIEKIFILGCILIGISIIYSFAMKVLNQSYRKFLLGFIFISILSILALVMSSQVSAKAFGFGYAFWALTIGLLISNTMGTPNWVKPSLKSEFFIKTGLVLLGAEILFPKIIGIGLPALIVAWGVTPIVLIAMYYFGTRYLKLNKNLSIVISTATSVCGVSAAIAASAASKAKKEELTLAVGMSMIFTVLMMIGMPVIIKIMGLSPEVGGAWIGGTIDATGAVVAAGAVLGNEAMNIAAIVKMLQNLMIGVIAFVIAVIWTSSIKKETTVQQISFLNELWNRLPKFILGFIGASLFFSFILYPIIGEVAVKEILKVTVSYRDLLFTLAFICIGLESNFKELKSHMVGGKPIILYVVGQLFNLILTLFVAWLVFSGITF